ncbi:hypothetical protein Calkr_2098 [Caldicellulosiruptor acetigenus I77R1B]|uniref:Type 4 fimbrial biogenesis protein PilX N-terminal domain-containing protein n=2 Tax=Caldicellulosiruptor acetigenus TaxID=301953 RepID=E4S5D1_CALA7|nr:hypothetical protein Calkr_2098 [Caldicellulosiruptor acetigenus I77R1B]
MSKVLKGKRGDANLLLILVLLFVMSMMIGVIYAVIQFTSETTFIEDMCELAVKRTAYVFLSAAGTAEGSEYEIGDNLMFESKLREEFEKLLAQKNISLTALNVSYDGQRVEVTGTAIVKTQIGGSDQKNVTFKYTGRFHKNFGN